MRGFVDFVGIVSATSVVSCFFHAGLTVVRNSIRALKEAKQEDELEAEGARMLYADSWIEAPQITPRGRKLRTKVYRREDIETLVAKDIARKHRMPDGNFQYHAIYMVRPDGVFIGMRMELARLSRRSRK